MVFSVVMYRFESWTIKKAECQRIDAFELWCWKRFLRVTWTARRSNQSVLKEISSWIFIGRTDAEVEASVLQSMVQRANLLENTLMVGKIEGKRRRGQQMMRWLCSIIQSTDMNLSKLQEIVEDSRDWHAAVHGVVKIRHDLVTEQKQSEFLA